MHKAITTSALALLLVSLAGIPAQAADPAVMNVDSLLSTYWLGDNDPHSEPTWTTVSGRGSIWSFAIPHPPLLPPFSELSRYNVVVVALEEDATIRLVGNLVAREGGSIDEVSPEAIEIGARVRVVFEPVSEEIHLPRWTPAP